MDKNKIVFLKSLSILDRAFALKVRDNPKYDNHPLIDKIAIDKAVEKYGNKLLFLRDKNYGAKSKIDVNIEGHFLAQNIPEVPSIVIDELCTERVLLKTLNNNNITHIALSAYATGLNKTIEIIKIIQSEFKDIELYIGGVGTVYPDLQELVKPRNICSGNGVNWLREKFGLKPIHPGDFKIPRIYGKFAGFPISVKVSYFISQIGCPYNCDFCITSNFLKHEPFSDHNKIISFLKDLSSNSGKDIFLYISEPNAFFPLPTWKNVFKYFETNPKSIDNNIFLIFPGSLYHINKFDLERIQKNSPLKFFIMNYGIESTLKGNYIKNKGEPKKVIERLSNLGIITIHTYIIGLPFHTKKTINLEIKNNLKYNSDIISVNNFKPIPKTPLYNQLKLKDRLYDRTLPPEFLYAIGFLPFNHEYVGGGFRILEYLFKAYYEWQLKSYDRYDILAKKLLDLFAISNSRKIKRVAELIMKISK
ncbi:MAG: hypothetical protein WBH31_17730 [Promethearchaeia archaeon]